jgi:hypothetical protein
MNGEPMRDAAYDLQASVCKAFDAGVILMKIFVS